MEPRQPAPAITPVKKHTQARRRRDRRRGESTTWRSGATNSWASCRRFRGMMLPRDLWPVMLREFEQQWSTYKQANGLLDFTDLIDACLRDVHTAPKNPSVIFADEAQDLNRMQLTLIRKWGRARRLLHRGRRRRPDHLFVHRRHAGGHPRSRDSRWITRSS